MHKNPVARGFSLVELLIAMALLAILGSIAVSESMTSKTRSDVARVRMDLRRVALALEAYRTDHGDYPVICPSNYYAMYGQRDRGPLNLVWSLTTPVAYLTSVDIPDPYVLAFMNVKAFYNSIRGPVIPSCRPYWYLVSFGPDRIKGPNPISSTPSWTLANYISDTDPDGTCHFDPWQYDPSNGTISKGDILTYQWR